MTIRVSCMYIPNKMPSLQKYWQQTEQEQRQGHIVLELCENGNEPWLCYVYISNITWALWSPHFLRLFIALELRFRISMWWIAIANTEQHNWVSQVLWLSEMASSVGESSLRKKHALHRLSSTGTTLTLQSGVHNRHLHIKMNLVNSVAMKIAFPY